MRRAFYNVLDSLFQMRREFMLLILSFLFTLLILCVFSWKNLSTMVYRDIHKGIFDDIMISRQDRRAFISLERTIKYYQKLLDEAKAQQGNLQPIESAMRTDVAALKESTNTIETVIALIDQLFTGIKKDIIVSKRNIANLNIIAVTINNQDISKIHGQMDIWLKSIRAGDRLDSELSNPQVGQALISESLYDTFCVGTKLPANNLQITVARYDQPGKKRTFRVMGTFGKSSSPKAIVLHPEDMKALGYGQGFTVIGINFPGSAHRELADFKTAIAERIKGNLLVATSTEKSKLNKMQIYMTAIPSVLLGLTVLILVITFVFVVRNNFESRRQELCVFTIYNYDIRKNTLLFSMLNLWAPIIGLLAALVCIVINWPISFENLILAIGSSSQLDINRFNAILDPLANLYAYLLILLTYFIFITLNLIYLRLKRIP